ncbi:hypothetical protein F7725_014086 [Dissostichus mawsoni]|uniref:Uncharacterized protein n=1 Tax=Dissostichus mawsoni TaxID=36200 RepID=A0A7J5YZB6_DISMA|nr:hypothetical protein F7725_014086 [Dissostichus mawsoni]
MKLEKFREVMRSVVGPDVEDTWVERFFSEVDISCSGQVRWQQLCSYLLLEFRERESLHPQSRSAGQTAADQTLLPQQVRLVAVSHPPPLRYISVSKGGQISVWSSGLHILKTLGLAGDPTEEVASTRRFRGWTSDAVYMGNVHTVAIATDCRDLHFINVSTGAVFQDAHLFGFRSVPTALCYWHDAQSPEQPSLLLMGDDKGGVHLLWFLNPSKGLFKSPSKTESGPQRIFFPEPITRVMFEPGTNVVMTSSESDNTSVVFMNVILKQEPYIWTFKQLMVTGGCDRAVRLWTRFITSRPVASLLGHRTAVLDGLGHFQPSVSEERRPAVPLPAAGSNPRTRKLPLPVATPPLTEQPLLAVACKDYLAVLSLSERRRGGGGWLTDEGREPGPNIQSGPPLSCALYNPTLRQVATGHEDSSVSLWDVETGRRRLQILNAHGEEGITCMALDSSHRRLITGVRNGTIKPVDTSEVTGLTCLHDNQFLTVGWSRRVAQYDVAAAKDLYVRADMSWKSSGVHKSDILAVSQCSPLGVIATGSYDGEVIIWRLETQGPEVEKPRRPGVIAGRLSLLLASLDRHTPMFYSPEQPGERVLSLSSDQPQNTILVSGDTTGWLQIWDISDYGLDVQHDESPVCERPPLLQRWRAHERALVSVDVFEVSGRLFVLQPRVMALLDCGQRREILWVSSDRRLCGISQSQRLIKGLRVTKWCSKVKYLDTPSGIEHHRRNAALKKLPK